MILFGSMEKLIYIGFYITEEQKDHLNRNGNRSFELRRLVDADIKNKE